MRNLFTILILCLIIAPGFAQAQIISSVKLNRSLLVESADESMRWDYDRDGLIDSQESILANAFRPYCIFDSDEKAREPYEPVVLFQVRPLDLRNGSNLRIKIQWVFLFRRDGGYGPSSSCRDAHEGDNDTAFYELKSSDSGVTWQITKIGLGGGRLEWPRNSKLEVYSKTHPIIYMSAHKHHEYFDTSYDHKDSPYSDWGCNDDVNGRGARVLVDLQSLIHPLAHGYAFCNNVGEPEHHSTFPFVDKLDKFYPGHSAWGDKKFYSCPPTKTKWMTHPFQRGLFRPTQLSPANGEVFSHYPRRTTLKWDAVDRAKTYTVEIEYKAKDKWYPLKKESGITTTSYTFNFVGKQPGRWRVWAVGEAGNEGPKTGWWEFEYTI